MGESVECEQEVVRCAEVRCVDVMGEPLDSKRETEVKNSRQGIW